jgi:hypothetical protein
VKSRAARTSRRNGSRRFTGRRAANAYTALREAARALDREFALPGLIMPLHRTLVGGLPRKAISKVLPQWIVLGGSTTSPETSVLIRESMRRRWDTGRQRQRISGRSIGSAENVRTSTVAPRPERRSPRYRSNQRDRSGGLRDALLRSTDLRLRAVPANRQRPGGQAHPAPFANHRECADRREMPPSSCQLEGRCTPGL